MPTQAPIRPTSLVTHSVRLSGAGSTSAASGTTYAWTQLATDTLKPIGAADLNRVTLNPVVGTSDATFKLPFYQFGMTKALTFQLAVTAGGVTEFDQVVITPHADTLSVSKATWKPGDFRVVGAGATPGSTITVRPANGTPIGTFTAAADGSFDLRVRNNRLGNPGNIYVDSNMGGTAGPIKVA